MNWQNLLHDKRALAVAGIGGVAGLYVLFKNKGSAGTASSAASDAGVAGSSGSSGTPTFSDGGSDIAATLGNFSTELQGILQNYADTVATTAPGSTSIPPATTTPVTKPPASTKPIKPPTVVTAPRKGSTKTPPKKTTPKPSKNPFTTYKIKKGDTLSEIAKKDHTTVGAIAKLNGIKNVNLIYAGHTLKIPTK